MISRILTTRPLNRDRSLSMNIRSGAWFGKIMVIIGMIGGMTIE